jgi:formimidoylglutamate deiminase
VAADDLREILSHRSSIDPSAPFHIHVAEQPAEVEACVAHYGMRPVEWLLDTATPDEAWCLIHATHVDSEELRRLAATDAVVGLCPTTEADLGDGVFPLPEFLRLGGRFAIGSDANVSVSPLEEIRLLEYVQRLVAGRRNVDGVTGDPGAATRRYLHALDGGRRAAGQRTGRLEPGFSADLVVLDSSHELLRERSADEQLQACVFSADASAVGEVAIAGRFPG